MDSHKPECIHETRWVEILKIREDIVSLTVGFKELKEDVKEIKFQTQGLNGLREKVRNLDRWHWLLISGVVMCFVGFLGFLANFIFKK